MILVRRIGNDIPVEWTIERNGSPESFDGFTLKLYTSEVGGGKTERTGFTHTNNVIHWTWHASQQDEPGTYLLTLEEYDNEGNLVNSVDSTDSIKLTSRTSEQGDSENPSSEAASFVSNIVGVAYTYETLSALINQANDLILRLGGISSVVDGKGSELNRKIDEVNAMIRQAQQYQAVWGSPNPYTDAKFAEAINESKMTFSAIQGSIEMLKGSMLNGFDGVISPLAVNTMQALIGSKSLQFEFISDIDTDNVIRYEPVIYGTYSQSSEYIYGSRVVYNGGRYFHYGASSTIGVSPDDASVWSYEGVSDDDSDTDRIAFGDAFIVHRTIGIGEQTESYDIHQYQRWEVSGSSESLPDSSKGYYVYIKAEKDITPDDESKASNNGGTGTASFLVSDTGMKLDPGDGYYYFLFATLNAVSDGGRYISYWNGFTSVSPSQVMSNRLSSTDGAQYIDFLKHSFRIGLHDDTKPSITWNEGGSGELRIRGGISVSPSGDEFPLGTYRGDFSPGNAPYYRGDVVFYEGATWICVAGEGTTLFTPGENDDWKVYAQKGAAGSNGSKTVTITIYNRTAENTTPAIEDGATATYNFANDSITIDNSLSNSGWFASIPPDSNGKPIVWSSVGTASTDGNTATIRNWTTPAIMSKDGADGADGANGYNNAEVAIYKRSYNEPDKPSSDCTYLFNNGSIQGLDNGWTPFGGLSGSSNLGYVWVSKAIVSSTSESVTITANMWSEPERLTGESGMMGKVMRGINAFSSDGIGDGGEPYQGLDDFYPDDPDHIYYDIVYTKSGNNTTFWYCKNEKNQDGTRAQYITPGTPEANNVWVRASNYDFVATNVLLASNAFIDLLGANQIYVKDNDGNIGAGMSGGNGVNFWAGGSGPNNNARFRVSYDGKLVATDAVIKGSIECEGDNFSDGDNSYAIKSGKGIWAEGWSFLDRIGSNYMSPSVLNVVGSSEPSYIRCSRNFGIGLPSFAEVRTEIGDSNNAGRVSISAGGQTLASHSKIDVTGGNVVISRGGEGDENVVSSPGIKRIVQKSQLDYDSIPYKDPETLYLIVG